jgi:hypothetical protein
MSRTLGICAFALALIAAAPASAATVEASGTEDLPPSFSLQSSTITVRDAGAEANTLTMSLVGPDSGLVRYAVRDASAPLTAGAGCTGGGAPGSEVTCLLPRSRAMSGCHRDFCADAGRQVSFRIELGGGVNSFDSSTMPASDGGTGTSLDTAVVGGSDADTIVTGAGGQRIAPGLGADVVHTGEGYDTVDAAHSAPDGGDLLDLGAGTDAVSYYGMTVPVDVSLDGAANDGVAGEGDNLINVEQVTGGSAGDILSGSELGDALLGGPGEDRIAGNAGDDRLDGSGNDDAISGGAGDDLISGNQGADRVSGEDGDDHIHGDQGDDRLGGGAGDDLVEGGTGADRARGNSGADRVQGTYSGRDDHDPDRLDCGTGDDRARVGDEDETRGCEFVGPLIGP